MKKIINSLLASTMVLSLATSSFAQEIPPQEEILQEEETLSTSTYNPMYSLYSTRVSATTLFDVSAMRSVTLCDLNGNGYEELILDYHASDLTGTVRVQIWSYDPSAQKINLLMQHEYGMPIYGCDISIGIMPDGTLFVQDNVYSHGMYYSKYTFIHTADGTQLDSLQLDEPSYDPDPDWQNFHQKGEEISKSAYESRIAYWESMLKMTLEYGRDDLPESWKYTASVPTGTTTPTSICGFSDVKPTDWYGSFTQYVVENGFMTKGYTLTNFNPDDSATRGMVSEGVYQIFSQNPYFGLGQVVLKEEEQFSDTYGSIYEEVASYCKYLGIMNGYGDGTLGVNDPISREDFATIIYALYGRESETSYVNIKPSNVSNLNQFSDKGQISSWAEKPLSWAIANELMSGSDGKITPQGSLSRAELATIIYKCVERDMFNQGM